MRTADRALDDSVGHAFRDRQRPSVEPESTTMISGGDGLAPQRLQARVSVDAELKVLYHNASPRGGDAHSAAPRDWRMAPIHRRGEASGQRRLLPPGRVRYPAPDLERSVAERIQQLQDRRVGVTTAIRDEGADRAAGDVAPEPEHAPSRTDEAGIAILEPLRA